MKFNKISMKEIILSLIIFVGVGIDYSFKPIYSISCLLLIIWNYIVVNKNKKDEKNLIGYLFLLLLPFLVAILYRL